MWCSEKAGLTQENNEFRPILLTVSTQKPKYLNISCINNINISIQNAILSAILNYTN